MKMKIQNNRKYRKEHFYDATQDISDRPVCLKTLNSSTVGTDA